MSEHDEAKFDLVRHWMLRAEEDFAITEELHEAGDSSPGEVGVQARQAVEKYLKAFLAWHEVDFSGVSDIPNLLDRVSSVNTKLARSLRECEALQGFAPADESEGVSPEREPMEAQDAVNLAGNTREEIRYALGEFVAWEEKQPDPVEESLVTVFESGNRIEMEMAQLLLREAGIECFTVGNELQDLFALGRFGVGENPVTGPARIQVRAEDEEDAERALDQLNPEALEGENDVEEET